MKLVADFESSELAQRGFASERRVSFSNLRNWLDKLREETPFGMAGLTRP